MIAPAETPDADLVRGAQAGDREATELLLILQSGSCRLAVRMFIRPPDVDRRRSSSR